jgi:hypothetical protein
MTWPGVCIRTGNAREARWCVAGRPTHAGGDSACRRSLYRGLLVLLVYLFSEAVPPTRRCASAMPLGSHQQGIFSSPFEIMKAYISVLLLCFILTGCAKTTPSATPTVIQAEDSQIRLYKAMGDPELTEQLLAALESRASQLSVDGYGGGSWYTGYYCKDVKTGETWFEVEESGLDIVLIVDSLEDRDKLGDLAMEILFLLKDLSMDGASIAQSAKIELKFESDDRELTFEFPMALVEDLLERDLNGAEVLEALDQKP